jgi:hypothetical protein
MRGSGRWSFALVQDEETVLLETDHRVSADTGDVHRDGRLVTVTARRPGPPTVTVTFS